MKERIANWIYHALSFDCGGSPGAPGNWLAKDFPARNGCEVEFHAQFSEDGWSFWLGDKESWRFDCHANKAIKLAWFILWDYWAKGTWFGLRRKLWFWALSVRVQQYRILSRNKVA